MRRLLIILSCFLFLGLLIPRPARAFEFIESRTSDSVRILRVRAAGLTPPDNIRFDILETLKGQPAAELTQETTSFRHPSELVAHRTELLLFLSTSDTRPRGYVGAAIYLHNAPPDSPSDEFRNLDLQPLTTYPQLAAAIRAQGARPAPAPTILVRTLSSRDSPYAPGIFELPNDPQFLEPFVRRWLRSPDPWQRALACSTMQVVDIPHRTELLKPLLNDPALTLCPAHLSPSSRRVYFVRAAAYRALHMTTAPDLPVPTLIEDRPVYRNIPLAWPLLLLPALVVITYVLLRLRRRPILRSLAHALTLASTLLAAALLALWIRSYAIADDCFFAGFARILSFTSHNGSLQFLHVPGYLDEQPLCYASLEPRGFFGCVRSQADPYFWHGFGSGTGGFAGSFPQDYSYQYDPDFYVDNPNPQHLETDPGEFHAQRLILPFRYFAPLAFLPALLWLPLTILPTLRRRHRRTHGLCPTCSYDLRAHLPNSEPTTHNPALPPRCPECGTPIPSPARQVQPNSPT